MTIDKSDLFRAYRSMSTIRVFEERVEKEFKAGNIPGFTHVYLGQEASGVGVCHDLANEDLIASTHRGHGHCIAKGCDVRTMMLELFGKAGGLCGGKGGSMHVADFSKGMLGANAIVGGSPPIIVGAALSQKIRHTGNVAVVFSGDGGSNQGTTFEALNMAVVLKVPAIFIFENNGYGEHTAAAYAIGAPSLVERTRAFGMPAEQVDGTDFFEVRSAMARATAHARAAKGPYAIETMCFRFRGHFVGDPQPYRLADELSEALAGDPLRRFRERVIAEHWLNSEELDEVEHKVGLEIDRAVREASAAPRPDLATLERDVYAQY